MSDHGGIEVHCSPVCNSPREGGEVAVTETLFILTPGLISGCRDAQKAAEAPLCETNVNTHKLLNRFPHPQMSWKSQSSYLGAW